MAQYFSLSTKNIFNVLFTDYQETSKRIEIHQNSFEPFQSIPFYHNGIFWEIHPGRQLLSIDYKEKMQIHWCYCNRRLLTIDILDSVCFLSCMYEL